MKLILPGVLLLYSTFTDIKSREISGIALMIFTAAALILQILVYKTPAGELIAGASMGAFLIPVSILSRGRLGMGDALLVLVTGLYLGFFKSVELLMCALYISFFFSIFLLIIRRKKDISYPFVPFLMLAYLIV